MAIELLPDRMLARMRRSVARAAIRTAQLQAQGGSAWIVTGGAGTGIGGGPVTTSYGTVTAWAWLYQLPQVTAGTGAHVIRDTQWRLAAHADQAAASPTGDGLRIGRNIRSATDSTFAFTIQDVRTEPGFLIAIVERVP